MMRQPTIRPGQRKPYAKATRQQIEDRTHAAELLLFLGLGRTTIPALPPVRCPSPARVRVRVSVRDEKEAICRVERSFNENLRRSRAGSL
jgi:hypothetical protein